MSNKRHLYSASSCPIWRSKHSYTPPWVSFSLVQQITCSPRNPLFCRTILGSVEGGSCHPPLGSGPSWQPHPCYLTLAVLGVPKAGTTQNSHGDGQQVHHW